MAVRNAVAQTMGIVLVGTHPWTNSAFDKLPPRPLLPVGHRPLIAYALSWLENAGIQKAAVCANRETQVLESRLHRHVPAGMTLSYHEDRMPRGAAGAIRDATASSDAEMFVIADGTSIPNVDLPELLRFHRSSGAAVTAVVHNDRQRDGRTLQVPTGIYVFDRQALDIVPANGFFDIKENLIPQLHRAGLRVIAHVVPNANPRVLDAASYLAVNEWMVENLVAAATPPDGYVKSGSCLFHRDAVIADDATFVGPVLVGPGAQVLSGAVVVGPTSIGRDAVIASGALVSRSAIWRRCVINEDVVTDRSIVADDSILERGTQAYRQVRVVVAPQVGEDRSEPSPAGETATADLFRKMRRMVLGTAFSRYPVAQ